MELTLIVVVGVISIVAVASLSDRLGLAAPLGLVIVGIGLSFVPGMPHPSIAPEWVLGAVLPVLLYSSSVTMPAHDFRRNLKAISGLAVILVAVTTLGAGWLLHAMLPGIGWPIAFAVAAVISPTDAVAATAVGRRMGLPARLLTLLEGEGLVNDASALVLLRSAVAAAASAVSVWGVVGDFFYAVVVAAGIGVVVGLVNVRIRALLKDTVLNTAVSFVVPFLAYVPAEEARASGVLAVVVAGLVTGHQSPKYLAPRDRLSEGVNWRTLAFLLESGLFLLMGLSLKTLIDEVHEQGLSGWNCLTVGLAASGLCIVARIVFVAPLVAAMRADARKAESAQPQLEQMQAHLDAREPDGRLSAKRKEHLQHRLTKVSADVAFKLSESMGWRGGVVLAWSGMRGAITVAAAQTLPADTPGRAQLILIAFVVATTTLLAQGLTLPEVIRLVNMPGDDPARLRDEYVRLVRELTAAAADALDEAAYDGPDGEEIDPAIVDRVRADTRIRTTPADGTPKPAPDDVQRAQYLRLRLIALSAEHDALLAARSRGTYSSRALSNAQQSLDMEAARMQQFSERIEG